MALDKVIHKALKYDTLISSSHKCCPGKLLFSKGEPQVGVEEPWIEIVFSWEVVVCSWEVMLLVVVMESLGLLKTAGGLSCLGGWQCERSGEERV